MQHRHKKCDGCTFWTKLKFGRGLSGLCDLKDLRCPGDYGCQDYKPKSYKEKMTLNPLEIDLEERV